MTKISKTRPVVLCVCDGWGHREEPADNAVRQARTPVFDRLSDTCPRATLDACGIEVGLPDGQMGNSEVGHLNLGAGRIVDQDIRRVDAAVADGSLGDNSALVHLIDRLQATGGTCHLMGLMSPGGVHSHQDHLVALAGILDDAGIPVSLHAFLDGRDTPPQSAAGYLDHFLDETRHLGGLTLATVSGRYYAMDRDKRWERVQVAHDALMAGIGEGAADGPAAIGAAYGAGVTDEFLVPAVIGAYGGMKDRDGILMGNFRADRAREILTALLDPGFEDFERKRTVSFDAAVGLVEYSGPLNRHMAAMFPAVELDQILGQLIADAGLRQLRIAETEKYAHVTFFFNGGVESPFPGEERVLIPSPKVATYDLQPEMSAGQVTDRLVEAVAGGAFDFVLVNYANPDMVGHTGNLAAAIKAIETVDTCLGRLEEAVVAAGGAALITADHGNAETMRDEGTGEPFTSHTMNKVPLLLVNGPAEVTGLGDGRLGDVAPTLLHLMGLAQPLQMTGRSLLAAPSMTPEQADAQIQA